MFLEDVVLELEMTILHLYTCTSYINKTSINKTSTGTYMANAMQVGHYRTCTFKFIVYNEDCHDGAPAVRHST